jgi:outer membrane protein assembly factor BamB
VQYPGGLAARFRWGGTGRAADVFGISEATGALLDYGTLADPAPDRQCRAELRIESPSGSWTARFASVIFDEPQGVLWDTYALLLVKYGFVLYALEARTGELAWSHASGTPAVAVLASTRLDHVILQTELETIALRSDGEVAWRAAHSDVVTAAQIVAGRIDLTTYGGTHLYLDAGTGQQA